MQKLAVKYFTLIAIIYFVQAALIFLLPLPSYVTFPVAAFLFGIGILLILKKAFAPIPILIDGLDVVSRGNYKYHAGLDTNDEYGILSKSVDNLIERLSSLYDQMNQIELEKDESFEKLKLSHSRQVLYSKLFENPNYAVFFCNFSGNIVDANQTASDLLGYEKHELLSFSFYNLFPREELSKTIEARKAGLDHNAVRYESQLLTRSGKHIDVEVSSNVFDFRTELIQNIVGDITARKNAERMLRESEEKFRTFMESVDDMIFITDKEGFFSYTNHSMLSALGYSQGGISLRRLQDITLDKNTGLRDARLDHFLTFESKYKELNWQTSNQNKIPGELKTVGIYDDDYNLIGLRGIFRDISERKKVQESQRLAQLGKISADISHEVKNRLTAILSITDFLIMEIEKDSELYKDLNIIKEECLYLDDFSRQMLNFSKSSESQAVMTDIHKVLDRVTKLMEKSLSKSQIRLSTNYDRELPPVMIDEKQMSEVFLNILQNAQDASSDKSGIHIYTTRDQAFIFVQIQDHGEGISEDNISKIFDPFFTTKKQGTGLGMSASYGIVQAHGGELIYESQLGRGTTVTVKLPVSAS